MKIWQLEELKHDGYHVLFRAHDKDYFVPLKESYENIIEKMNQAPLDEDEVLDIEDAIKNYDAYKEFLSALRVVYSNHKT